MTTSNDVPVTDETASATAVAEPPVAKKTKKPAKKAAAKLTAKGDGILTIHQATKQALKDGGPVDVGRIFMMPISTIHRYDNPRHEPESLYQRGYVLFGDPAIVEPKVNEKSNVVEEYVSLAHLALSDNMELVRKYVSLIEEFEGPVSRLLNPQGKVVMTGSVVECKARLKGEESRTGWKIEAHLSAPQSIVELAMDIYLYGQLDPIEVRDGAKLIVLDGGRRLAALLYLHAKTRVLRTDKAEDKDIFGEGTPKEYDAVVQATDLKATGDDFLLACKLNLSRKAFTPLQEGRVYHDMLRKINPASGKVFTSKEAALALGVEYGTFRNREALWRDPEFVEGKRIKGLTEIERRKLALGEITVTAASRKALGEKHYSETGAPQPNRARTIPLVEIHKKFDETPEKDDKYRRALAFCMGFGTDDKGYQKACKESNARIELADNKTLAAHAKKNRRVRKKKAA